MGWVREHARWILAGLVFAASFVWRYLDPGLMNDHFIWIAAGRQIRMYGEHPYRDFYEPGYFLQDYASAAAQLAFGDNLLGEVLLAVSLLSAGAALTFLLASEASRSTLIGALMAAFLVAMYPRLYNYPKVFLLVLGIYVCWRYADRPTIRNLVVIGLSAAVTFLFRHDLGLFVGAASAITLVAVHWRDGLRPLVRRSMLYGAAVVVPLIPFFLFLEASGGIVTYFRTGVEYSRQEADRSKIGLRPEFVADWTVPLVATQPPLPPPPARIKVRWAPGVTPEVRAELEQRFQLRDGDPERDTPSNRTWTYQLADTSGANVKALVTHRRVEDTLGIDRRAYRVAGSDRLLSFEALQRLVPLPRIYVLPGIIRPENALPWLVYLLLALPGLTLAVLLVTRLRRSAHAAMPNETPKILGAAVLCGLATPVLLRNPFLGRLADTAAPSAVLAAWLLGYLIRGRVGLPALPRTSQATGRRRYRPTWRGASAITWSVARWAAAAVLLLIAAASIDTTADVGSQLNRSRLLSGPTEAFERGGEVFGTLTASPAIDTWAAPDSTELRGLARYVYACTKPTDRVLVVAKFAPDFFFYTERAFGAGGFFPDQDRTIGKLKTESVPIIVVNADEYRWFAGLFDRVAAYLSENYRVALEAGAGGVGPYRVLVDPRLTPSGTYERWSLPCYP